jgi:tetratricopeptide (TPR) repeat protein
MAALTAALIVRDEARFIDECLESLAGRADEIVVVDTGSQDDTVARASRFPVKLYHFEWCNDFSAARNFALDRATGEWILYIDADERFDVPRPEMLRNVLADKSRVAWRLRFHVRLDWTPYAELRLFRNDPRIRFVNSIHERIQDGVENVARSDGLTVGDCDLALRHVGYEDDQSRKNPRNIPMLRARLAKEPDHLYSWWHLGQCLRLAGEQEGAIAAWENGIAAAERVPAALRQLSDAQSAESLIQLQIERGTDVTDLLRDSRARYPDHLSLQWIEATLALKRGDHEMARQTLERFLAIDPEQFYDPRLGYHKAMFGHVTEEALAWCHLRAGRHAEAAHFFRLAASHSAERGAEIRSNLKGIADGDTRTDDQANVHGSGV